MRCDKYLFEKGYTKSRSAAETLIREGCAVVDGKKVNKRTTAESVVTVP